MIAFTIHAYTTDSTEGVVISHDPAMTEEKACELWKVKNPSLVDSEFAEHYFAINQPLTVL